MRRSVLLVLGLSAGAAFFTACRDVAVAPTESAPPVALNVPTVDLDELATSSEGVTYSVTIDPSRDNVYSDGINSVRIPAGAICDPATSSYGPSHWDEPCVAARTPITLSVTLSRVNGGMVVHFGRDLRFAPTGNPAKQVVLTAEVPAVKGTTEPSSTWNILWVPSGEQRFVDESATDPSLATVVKRDEGRLVRRLKHFSGYYVHLGYSSECDPNVDEGCVAR